MKPDGGQYEGEWALDKMWGTGIWRSKDGDVYEGGFKEGERHGVGKYTSAHGEVARPCPAPLSRNVSSLPVARGFVAWCKRVEKERAWR